MSSNAHFFEADVSYKQMNFSWPLLKCFLLIKVHMKCNKSRKASSFSCKVWYDHGHNVVFDCQMVKLLFLYANFVYIYICCMMTLSLCKKNT